MARCTLRGTEVEFAGTDRFEIRRKLGAGGMGEVYEAFDRERGTTVAIKTLPRVTAASLYLFKREFRALADIEHPSLISLGELIESDGRWFFTMEYVDGVDFLRYVRDAPRVELAPAPSSGTPDPGAPTAPQSHASPSSDADVRARLPTEPLEEMDEAPPPCDEARLRHAARQLAIAIAALHAEGKTHRDIKPTNVLIDAHGKLTLLDFGLVTSAGDDVHGSTQGNAVGTAAYMAPEQALSGAVGPPADWYSFGVVLYEALTGRLPFTGGTAVELLMQKQQYEPPPPRARNPTAPRDLDALCSDLLIRSPDERPAMREILDRLGVDSTGSAPVVAAHSNLQYTEAAVFVGRDDELEALSAGFERARRGAAEVLLIEGESGLGKSMLISRFLDEVRDEVPDAVVLSGRCHERESVPYKALDGVIDGLSRYLRSLPRAETAAVIPRNAALLPRVFPVLGRVEEISMAPRAHVDIADGHVLRNRAFAALRELLYRCAERRPLLVWIDDFQWTDGDSLIALRSLVASEEAPRALFVLSSRLLRPGPTRGNGGAGELAEFLEAVDPTRARLGPLPAASATELARLLLEGAGRKSDETAQHIATETAGHPLYIAELARHTMESSPGAREKLRLADAISGRVAQLPTTTRWLLDLIAVAGTPLARDIIQAAARIDTEAFRKHIAILRVAHLVRTGGSRNEDPVEPYHDHVRQAALTAQDEARRRECHARLATALQTATRSGVPPEIVLVHLEGAGQRADAARFAEAAAERADEALSFDLAARLYATSIRLGEPGPERRRALCVKLGNATASAGRRAEAAQIFLEAVEDAPAADAIELQREAAESLLVSGHVDEGVDVLRRVLAEVGIAGPRSSSAALRSVILQRMWLRIRGLRFREREETTIAPHELRRVDACLSAAKGLGMTSPMDGTAFQMRHLRLALNAGETTRVAMGLALESLFTSTRGRSGRKRAEAVAARASDVAERHDSNLARGFVQIGTGMRQYQLGRFAAAAEAWALAQELLALEPGMHFEKSTVQLYQAWASFYLGRWRHFRRDVYVQLQLARERGDLYGATNFTSGVPAAAPLIGGQSQRAHRLTREYTDKWSHRGFHLQHYWEIYSLAQASLYDGDPVAAWAHLERRWRALRRSFLLRISLVGIEAHDLRARCAVALAASLPPDSAQRRQLVREARACLRAVRRSRLDFAAALDLLGRAALAQLDEQPDETVALLRRAVTVFEGADMAAHAEVARWRLAERVGGSEGAAVMQRAATWMREQGVAEPGRMVEVFAPGYGDIRRRS